MFLSTMFLAPHPPLDIPMPWHGKYNREEVVLSDNVGVWYLGLVSLLYSCYLA
ncbi:MAG: hypothetical protein LBN31_11140 [Hungatella sp.]|nr:hypothetical protein [Hungatella sp.]